MPVPGTYGFAVFVDDNHEEGEKGHRRRPALECGQWTPWAVDLDTDSDNDGDIDQSDDSLEEGSPGRLVPLNNDDDNGNGVLDLTSPDDDENADEDDLVKIELGSLPDELLGYLTLQADQGGSKIRVWASAVKHAGENVDLPVTFTPAWAPEYLWIEGIEPSHSPGDVVLTLVAPGGVSDTIRLTVVGVIPTLPEEVLVNSDDDNCNGAEDRDDGVVEEENDLGTGHVILQPSGLPGTVTVTHTAGIDLWEDGEKNTEVTGSYEQPLPDPVCVEGKTVSQAEDDQSVTAAYAWNAVTFQRTGTTTVIPRNGASEAFFKLYREVIDQNGETQYVEVDSPVGGPIYVGLHIKVGAGERVCQDQVEVTVRIKEECDLHEEPDNVLNRTLNLSSGFEWHKKTSVCGEPTPTWDENAGESPLTDNKDGSDPVEYRHLFYWDTQSQPLGHNELHSVKLHAICGDTQRTRIMFEEWEVGPGWVNPYESGPEDRSR